MTIAQTAAASVGRLGLAAAAFGRPTLTRASERPGAAGRPSVAIDSLYELAVNAAVAIGWLSERTTLRSRSLDKEARVTVTAKDVLVGSTVLTGAAALVGMVVTRRESAEKEPSPDADGEHSYVQTMTKLNRTSALLAVATTPFINFALFDSYHPHPIRSFFSVW